MLMRFGSGSFEGASEFINLRFWAVLATMMFIASGQGRAADTYSIRNVGSPSAFINAMNVSGQITYQDCGDGQPRVFLRWCDHLRDRSAWGRLRWSAVSHGF